MSPAARPVLQGVRVLDVGRYIAGPYCAALLAHLGADVIRIEPVAGGDDRHIAPLAPGGDGALFLQANGGKRSLTLDLASVEGRRVFTQLVATADVVVANLPPRALAALGLDYASLTAAKPDIILTSITAFGSAGPDRDRPGFDGIAQAMSGAMYMSGLPGQPMKAAAPYVDFGTALSAAFGTLAALTARAQTGQGQQVEASLLETGLVFSASTLSEQAVLRKDRVGTANRGQLYGPADTLPTKDGFVLVQVLGRQLFERWVGLIGEPQWLTDPRFASDEGRGDHAHELSERLACWCAARTTAEALAALQEARIPCAPVLSPQQALDHPQVAAADVFAVTSYPRLPESIPVARAPVRLAAGMVATTGRAPTCGEHTTEILDALGYDADAIDALRARGVV